MFSKGKKKKKKLQLSATGLFAAASAEADLKEKELNEQQQRLEEERKRQLQEEPQLLSENSDLRRNRIRKGGPPLIRTMPQHAPILRVGMAPGPLGIKQKLEAAAGEAELHPTQQHQADDIEKTEDRDGKIYDSQDHRKANENKGLYSADAEHSTSKPMKRRKMDAMLDEMKERQRREALVKAISEETAKTVKEKVDTSNSTNIAVRNLASSVTEEILLREFGKFGPIVSIQILWPEDPRSRNPNSGFVAFKYRKDAEIAYQGLQKLSLYDYEISLEWSEPIKNARELTPLNKDDATDNIVILKQGRPSFVDNMPKNALSYCIKRPRNLLLLQRIDRTAEYVATDGNSFESMLKEREQDNPTFSWLFDITSDEYAYYRWRVLANVMGEKQDEWRQKPFRYYAFDSTWFIPPPPFRDDEVDKLNKLRSLQMERREQNLKFAKDKYMTGAARERKINKIQLEKEASDRLVDLMKFVTLERSSILEVMGFCLDYSEFAKDCAHIILTSILSADDKCAPHSLIAKVYVLSDVLHNANAAVKNASAYRNELRPKLPEVFEKLHRVYRDAAGRMSANNIKLRVCRILEAWRSWMLLSPMFVLGLETTFLYFDRIDTLVEDYSEAKIEEYDKIKVDLNDLDDEKFHSKCQLYGIPMKEGMRENLIKLVAFIEVETKSKRAKPIKPAIETEPEETDNLLEIIPTQVPSEQVKDTTAEESSKIDENDSDLDGEPLDESDLDGVPLESDEELG